MMALKDFDFSQLFLNPTFYKKLNEYDGSDFEENIILNFRFKAAVPKFLTIDKIKEKHVSRDDQNMSTFQISP